MTALNIPLRGAVQLDIVTDEEAGGNGALSSLLYDPSADEVVVLEPTSLAVHHGHRGCLSFQIHVAGDAHHMGLNGGNPDAVEAAITAVTALRALEERLLREARHSAGFEDYQRPLQLNISGISACGWHGSSPKQCTVNASLGFLPGRSVEDMRELIEHAVCQGTRHGPPIRVEWAGIHNDAYLGPPDGPLASRLRESARAWSPPAHRPQAWNVSCDARLYQKLTRAETVIFGSGDLASAHSDHESVDVDQVLRGVTVLVDFLAAKEARPDGAEHADS